MKLGIFETNHIYNLDCYEAIKGIPDKSVHLIVTDPPYKIENTCAGSNSKLAKSIQNMNNELEENNLTCGINYKILEEFIRVMKKPNIYIWCNHKQIPDYLDFFVKKNNCSFDILIWNKINAAPLFNNKYLTDKEYCLYFRKNAYCNPQNYDDAKTIFELPINIKDKNKFNHPNCKPIEILNKIIKNSSKENDIVLDAFLGSGTTAVVCKNTNRQYIGFEINKKWFDVAQDRLNNIDASGQTSMFTI